MAPTDRGLWSFSRRQWSSNESVSFFMRHVHVFLFSSLSCFTVSSGRRILEKLSCLFSSTVIRHCNQWWNDGINLLRRWLFSALRCLYCHVQRWLQYTNALIPRTLFRYEIINISKKCIPIRVDISQGMHRDFQLISSDLDDALRPSLWWKGCWWHHEENSIALSREMLAKKALSLKIIL